MRASSSGESDVRSITGITTRAEASSPGDIRFVCQGGWVGIVSVQTTEEHEGLFTDDIVL